ncbi:MAG TPA: preprotein translocase subunit SecE [Phycisphaerae bacterium]|nr:preprotein translocase subunit SecE [Phycisphaerae bacterium]
MTTLDGKVENRGLFSVYKPGQGKYVRWGTVAGLSIFILTGAYWLGEVVLAMYGTPVKAAAVVVWVGVFGMATFLLVNSPKFGEFLIMTESEMRKVTWPSRRDVINSTKIVIIMTLILALMLWIVDIGFLKLFELLHILRA